MSDFGYVKKYYDVPACMGMEIEFMGERGVIVKDRGHYIGVNFDKNKPGVVSNVHPTDGVTYLGIKPVREG